MDLGFVEDGRVSEVRRVGPACVSGDLWFGAVDTVVGRLEQSSSSGAMGQLFARRGVFGVLFGDRCGRGENACGSLAGGTLGNESGGDESSCCCGVYGRGIDSKIRRVGGLGLPVSSGGLYDIGGTQGLDDKSIGAVNSGEVRASVDGECGVSVGSREAVSENGGVEGSSGGRGVAVSSFGSFVECGSPVVGKEKKKKRGKNQRDRAKYMQAIEAVNWRKSEGVKDEKSELRVSLEKKWAAQNELAAEKARKDLEYQKARDIDAEARKSRARLMKETESSKVATEKAFAFLKSTGNVAGFCETVVSDSSSPGLTDGSSPGGSVPGCTISPDSSASMHEFREAQKKIADQEFQIKKLTRQLALGKLSAGEEAAFTVHSDGEVSDDVKEAIAKCKNDFFDVDTNDDGFEDEKPRTLFAKRVAIPGADEYLYDNY